MPPTSEWPIRAENRSAPRQCGGLAVDGGAPYFSSPVVYGTTSPAFIKLDFARHGPTVTQLSSRRQLTVVLIRFAVFFAIVSFSARRLLRAVRRQG
jgi:hypothetical protein